MKSQLYYAVFTVVIIFFALVLLKFILRKNDLKTGKSEKEICKRDIQIGLNAILYVYRIPMIVYAIYGKSTTISYFTTFVALLTVPVILLYIVLPRVRTCFLRGSSRIPDYAKSVLITHVIWITIVYYLTTQNKFRSYATADGIAIAQFCFVILSCPFICYGWVIEENGFQLLSERVLTEVVVQEKVEDADSEPLDEESDTFRLKELQCKNCLQRYHSKIKRLTPRMLKQCGHSLCEGCADDLLSKNDQDFIKCPFCTTKTDVFGPAWFLPKNVTVIGMLEEIKELEIKPKSV